MQKQLTSTKSLDKLAADIRRDLSRMNDSRDAWIEATLDLCKHLAEARAKHGGEGHKGDKAFGKWLRDNKIELGQTDRIAAIAMGKKPDVTKDVLATTATRSLQLIYKNDFPENKKPRRMSSKSRGHAKPPKLPREEPSEQEPATTERPPPIVNGAPPARARPEHRKVTPEQASLIDALAPQVVSGDVTLDEVARQASAIGPKISVQPIKVAVAKHRGTAPPGDTHPLTESQSARLDAYKRRLDQQFAERVEERVRQRWKTEILPSLDERVFPQVQKEKDLAESIIKSRKGIYPKADYDRIRYCLHPDTAHLATTEQRAEAFDLFQKKKIVLLAEKELPTSFPPLPTAAEILARHKPKH